MLRSHNREEEHPGPTAPTSSCRPLTPRGWLVRIRGVRIQAWASGLWTKKRAREEESLQPSCVAGARTPAEGHKDIQGLPELQGGPPNTSNREGGP